MKKLFVKRILLVISVLLVAIITLPALFACHKKQTEKTLEDVFLSGTSPKEFTRYEDVLTISDGWSIYFSSSSSSQDTTYSDIGYIKDIDGFVIQKNGRLSIAKCSDKKVYVNDKNEVGFEGQLFPYYIGITALRVKNGVIVCKFLNGDIGAFDYSGKTLISRTKITGAANIIIDKVIKILDGGLIAVAAAYDKQGQSGYTSIYRPTTSGTNETRGELVCRVKNSAGDLSFVSGFESKYVSVIGNSEANYLFMIPDHASGEVPNLASNNGVVTAGEQDDYFAEITYIGNGRFLIHEDWTVESTDNYTYYDGNDYYVFKRRIYDAARDVISDYTGNADKVFLNLTNSYYDAARAGIDVKSYLKPGYMYASYGLFITSDKEGHYDQYILDEDLNIVMSLTGNFGINLSTKDKDTISAFDLIMTASDGNYYVPYLPSKLAVYNGKGEQLGENASYVVKSQDISNGVIIACIVDPDDKTSEVYTIFDLKCNELTHKIVTESGKIKWQKYDQIAAFRGYYTVAKRDGAYFLIGRDGVEVEYMTDGTAPLADMATSSKATGSQAMFKIGCYVFKKTTTDSEGNSVTKYGIKNFNANSSKNMIMDAQIESAPTLYSPSTSPTDVFVFETITVGDNSTIVIHKLA